MDGSTVVKTVTISTVTALNIVMNVLVIAVIARYPQLREDRSTLFMFSLTISDLANGCTAMPISAVLCSSATESVGNILNMHKFFTRMFGLVSLHSLCWVSLSKMVAIVTPLRYEQLLTSNRCYLIIGLTWLFGAGIAFAGITHGAKWSRKLCICTVVDYPDVPPSTIVGMTAGVAVPLVATIYASARIFAVIVKTHLRITAQVNSIGGCDHGAPSGQTLTLQSVRSGRNILIICLAALALTIPMVVYSFTVLFDTDMPSSFEFASVWILMCNSSVNGIIYLTVFRSVRYKMARMLKELRATCLPT